MNRRIFQRLATMRVREAQVLLASQEYSGAYYLVGYAVECGLKACIAKQTQRHDFPPEPRKVQNIYIHDLEKLLKEAGLKAVLDADSGTDPVFAGYWAAVKDWSERSRYEVWSRRQATQLLNAITDPNHGVLQWLQQRW